MRINLSLKIFSSIIFIGIANLNGQSVSFEWAKTIGGKQTDSSNCIAVDIYSNVLVTGNFLDTVDFDAGSNIFDLASHGSEDIFIEKINAQGDFLWAKHFGSNNTDGGYAITSDNSGNVYTTGYFSDTCDFDPDAGVFNLISNGDWDIFVVKLNAAGQFIWAKQFGSIEREHAFGINVDAFNNVLVTGYFHDTVDFDPGIGNFNVSAFGASDIFILKLDENGNFIWAKNMGGTSNERGFTVTSDFNSNVILAGPFKKTIDLNPDTTDFIFDAVGDNDSYILKLNSSGEFLWAKQIGGPESDKAYSVKTDGTGNVIVSGGFQNTTDFISGVDSFFMVSNGGVYYGDAFILKLDSTGNFIWARQIGGIKDDYARCIAIDSSGNVYATGVFEKTVDFDPGSDSLFLTATGSRDIFVLKLDNAGGFVWAKNMGSALSDFGFSITVDHAGNVYTCGIFQDSCDFDPSGNFDLHSSNGAYDFFIHKMQPCIVTASTMNVTACNTFSFYNQTYNSSGTYYHYLTNQTGCDSIVTINLTINLIDTSVTISGITLTAYATNALYQWVDCSNGFTSIAGETSQSFTPSLPGNYAVIISQNNCSDTSSCFSVTATAINNADGNLNTFYVYPNPSNGNLKIMLNKPLTNGVIEIKDITGKVVYSQTGLKSNAGFDFDFVSTPGFYFLTIGDENSFSTIKLMID